MRSSIVRVLALAAMLSAAPFARVGALEIDPDNPCLGPFETLNEAIDQTFEGAYKKDRDRRMMLSKLGDADLKVGALKICDAIDKIEDIIMKVEGLLAGNKQKIDPEVAQDILDAAAIAVGCLEGIDPCDD